MHNIVPAQSHEWLNSESSRGTRTSGGLALQDHLPQPDHNARTILANAIMLELISHPRA